ncbi:hypothetical protein [Petrachloros mirabilis]
MIRAIFIIVLLFLSTPAVPAAGPFAPAPPSDSVIVAAAKVYPGVRFYEHAMRDPILVEMAQQNANTMARTNLQNHWNWERRFQYLLGRFGMRGAEVCAETWPEQANASAEEIGKEFFDCWRYSTGHWSVVSRPHKRFGDGLARSNRGIWYGCLIVTD